MSKCLSKQNQLPLLREALSLIRHTVKKNRVKSLDSRRARAYNPLVGYKSQYTQQAFEEISSKRLPLFVSALSLLRAAQGILGWNFIF